MEGFLDELTLVATQQKLRKIDIMKIKFILIILLGLSNLTSAQTSYFEKFPFNNAVTIKLVSFSHMDSASKKWKSQSCINMPQLENGNVLEIDFSKMDKVKSLNLQQAAKLYAIANEDMDCPEYESSSDCNDVKNGYGILFFDETNEIFAVIDFCFECNYWSRYPGGTFEPICPQKLKLISQFFVDNGFEQ